jgi:hypothetical protein
VDAVQFDGVTLPPAGEGGAWHWTFFRTCPHGDGERGDRPAHAQLDYPGGFAVLCPGDWLVRRPDGTSRVHDAAAFALLYEPA